MKFRIIIFLFVLTAGCQKQAVKPEKDQLRLGFQNPPLSIRPRAFLTLPDDFADTFQITKNLQNIKNNGMGGLYLLFDTGELYTSPGDSAPNTNESIETFTRTLRAARELGLELGLVLTGSERQPQNGTMGMFTTTKVVRGPADIKIFFPAPLNEIKTTLKNNGSENLLPVYKNIAVLAYPVSGDSIIPDTSRIFTLTHAFHNDTLNWHVPSGWWKICRYDCANTGQKIHFPGHGDIGTAVDLLSHTALRDQVEFYLSAMQTKIDSIPKTGIKYLVCPGTPPSPKTWTPGLLGQFQKLRGYSPLPFLPVLNNYTVLNRTTSERFLCDFYKTLSEILKDNHTRVSREIFEKYGLYLFTTNPCASSGQYSTAGKCHPETQSNDSYQDDPEGFFPLTCNAYSLNTHTPVNSQLVVPWPAGTMVRPWFDFLSRCAFLLQQGHLMADILFYMGDHPSDIGQYFSLTSWQKYGYNCDMCATDDILFQLDVKNGNIVRPDGAEAKLLVLTNTKDINPLALKKIQQLVIAGATVIGPKPETSIGLSFGQYGDELVRDIADRMWKNINSGGYQMKNYGRGWVVCGESVQDVFAQRGVERNFSFTSIFDSADVDFIHRQTSTRDIFFIANRKNRRELLNCFFRTEKDHPQIWNPADGTIMNPAVYRQTETGIRMPLKLEPLSTLFVVFENLSQNHILSISKDNIPVFPYQEHGISIDEQPDAVCKQNFIHLHIWTPGEYSLLTTGNLAQLFYVEKIPSVQTDTKWQVFFERDSSSLHHQNTSERHNEETSPKSDTGSQPAAVKFKKQFTVPQLTELEEFNAFLMIDHMNIPGRIYLNGIKLGVLWNSTFKMDITRVLKRGANSLVYEPAENGQRTLKLLEKGTQSRGENRSPNPSDFETFLQDHTSIRFAKRMILDL